MATFIKKDALLHKIVCLDFTNKMNYAFRTGTMPNFKKPWAFTASTLLNQLFTRNKIPASVSVSLIQATLNELSIDGSIVQHERPGKYVLNFSYDDKYTDLENYDSVKRVVETSLPTPVTEKKDAELREVVLGLLQTYRSPKKTSEIMLELRGMGLYGEKQSKSALNSILYDLEAHNIVKKIGPAPPRWELL